MLSRGNTKLGSQIYNFSIPAGRTCPGKTPHCATHCYAMRNRYHSPSVKDRHALNYKRIRRQDFVRRMVDEIQQGKIKLVRIHCAGDFDRAAYVRKWIAIAAQCQSTRFFAYTRSWRDPAILSELKRFAALSNVQLFLSEDRDTGPPPKVAGTLRAFMVIDDLDERLVPANADLVFRDIGKMDTRVIKQMNGVQVCPYENGVDYSTPMTCFKCGLCWRADLARVLRSKSRKIRRR